MHNEIPGPPAPVFLLPKDRRKCMCIAQFIIAQCIIVFLASATVFSCVWSPDLFSFDYYKLASIMYLYDKKACGYSLHVASVVNLQLSNDTRGLNVLPIKWQPIIVTVSTMLSAKTRTYIEISLAIHALWMIIAIAFSIISRNNKKPRLLKRILTITFYATISIIIFDLSMAIVYVAHIKQSLTKGMIVRYSGWSVELKLESYEDFAGWLPMLASVCWMRGIIVLALNIYCCRIVKIIRNRIRSKEFKTRLAHASNEPIPEPKQNLPMQRNVLYYRPGELKPYVKTYF